MCRMQGGRLGMIGLLDLYFYRKKYQCHRHMVIVCFVIHSIGALGVLLVLQCAETDPMPVLRL